MKRGNHQFPKQLFVSLDYESLPDEAQPLLLADHSFETVDDGKPVGVYRLVEIKRKRVTHDLEKP